MFSCAVKPPALAAAFARAQFLRGEPSAHVVAHKQQRIGILAIVDRGEDSPSGSGDVVRNLHQTIALMTLVDACKYHS